MSATSLLCTYCIHMPSVWLHSASRRQRAQNSEHQALELISHWATNNLRPLLCLKITVQKYVPSVTLLGFLKTTSKNFGAPCIRTYQNYEQQAILLFIVLLKIILPTLALYLTSLTLQNGARGGVVVKALRYKPAGRGFDSRWCHWNFSVT